MTRSLKTSLIISILFVALNRLQPFWERYPGGLWNNLLFLAITVLFFWLITKIIIEMVRLIKQRRVLTIKLFVPILIMTVFLLDGMYNPFKIDFDKVYGPVVFRACYEGTQNQATFKLRDNGKFDIHWTSIISSTFFTGQYAMKGDTIFMNFDTRVPRMLGDTLIIKDEYLYRSHKDTLTSTYFYLGDCKGLN